jgi:hypothetical protein
VGWIKLILPNARIINTRRHPLDSCLAAYTQLFARGQHFSYDMLELAEFYRSYIAIMDHWHAVLPGQVLDVHYEETVTDPEEQVRRILDFCGLEFEDECLRVHATTHPAKTNRSAGVGQPIGTGTLGLWKKYRHHLQEWEQDLADILQALPETVTRAAG